MLRVARILALLACTASLATAPVRAQNGDLKPGEAAKGETGKDAARLDEIADAARSMVGLAARPECVWLGERAVGLMWRDDLDTAFRHLELYDRFGCPGDHIQVSFRCVVRQGNIDPEGNRDLQCPGAFVLGQPSRSTAAGNGRCRKVRNQIAGAAFPVR